MLHKCDDFSEEVKAWIKSRKYLPKRENIGATIIKYNQMFTTKEEVERLAQLAFSQESVKLLEVYESSDSKICVKLESLTFTRPDKKNWRKCYVIRKWGFDKNLSIAIVKAEFTKYIEKVNSEKLEYIKDLIQLMSK